MQFYLPYAKIFCMNNFEVQQIAKQTFKYLQANIRVGMHLPELRKIAEKKMTELGATSFWYWDVGAFIFSGGDTALSVSGRHYKTAEKVIAENDIITVDLSPQVGNVWGDFARTIIIENGKVIPSTARIKNEEWKNGLLAEEKLHGELMNFASPETTFEELYFYMNDLINQSGYKNLDFMGNLGHSIAAKKDDRIYIERGNLARLNSVEYFTFEPHIALPNGRYGYKRENIYYFEKGKLKEL